MGIELGLAAVPWIVSISMTGTQVLIYRRIRQGGFDRQAKVAVLIGVCLTVVDTSMDVAGVTAFMYGPAVGLDVIPPGLPIAWILIALMVAVLCGLWEWVIEALLPKPSSGGFEGGSGGGAFKMADFRATEKQARAERW